MARRLTWSKQQKRQWEPPVPMKSKKKNKKKSEKPKHEVHNKSKSVYVKSKERYDFFDKYNASKNSRPVEFISDDGEVIEFANIGICARVIEMTPYEVFGYCNWGRPCKKLQKREFFLRWKPEETK